MIQKKQKNLINTLVFNQLTYFFVGLFILLLILYPLSRNISKQYHLNREIKQLNDDINDLEGKNSELKNAITYLESDEFAEKEARLNLNMKKDGEEVVVIKTKAPEETEDTSLKKTESSKNISNPENWWTYFFNRR